MTEEDAMDRTVAALLEAKRIDDGHTPDERDLAGAPLISNWIVAMAPDGMPSIAGVVTGHPKILDGHLAVTSAVLRMDAAEGFHVAHLLVFAAQLGLVDAHWTKDIEKEWVERSLEKRVALTRASIESRRDQMNAAIPTARIEGYEALVDGIHLDDPDDRHVVAAAKHIGAIGIVTRDKKHLNEKTLAPHQLRAVDSAFLGILPCGRQQLLDILRDRRPKRTPWLPPHRGRAGSSSLWAVLRGAGPSARLQLPEGYRGRGLPGGDCRLADGAVQFPRGCVSRPWLKRSTTPVARVHEGRVMSLAVGVIGTGVMGAEHARILREHTSGAHLAAVCDADAAHRGHQVSGDESSTHAGAWSLGFSQPRTT